MATSCSSWRENKEKVFLNRSNRAVRLLLFSPFFRRKKMRQMSKAQLKKIKICFQKTRAKKNSVSCALIVCVSACVWHIHHERLSHRPQRKKQNAYAISFEYEKQISKKVKKNKRFWTFFKFTWIQDRQHCTVLPPDTGVVQFFVCFPTSLSFNQLII